MKYGYISIKAELFETSDEYCNDFLKVLKWRSLKYKLAEVYNLERKKN